jgi:hypothetical protein
VSVVVHDDDGVERELKKAAFCVAASRAEMRGSRRLSTYYEAFYIHNNLAEFQETSGKMI